MPSETWSVEVGAAPIELRQVAIPIPSLSTCRRGVFFVDLLGALRDAPALRVGRGCVGVEVGSTPLVL